MDFIRLNQTQRVSFVMIDSLGSEVPGLGNSFTALVSKNGGAFAPSTGLKGEISDGWYFYDLTSVETNTVGPLSMKVDGAGCIQQNLEYVVEQRVVSAINYTFTVTNFLTAGPIDGADVWITSDIAGLNLVWQGYTNAFGVALDVNNDLPKLDPGTWYFWVLKPGFIKIDAYPEVVS